ncbi:putative condensin-2 complex subunit G2, partial [Apostichopus japonicus]
MGSTYPQCWACLILLGSYNRLRDLIVSSIVSMEHLLARLEVASAPLARRLVSLLFNSFHPADQEADIKIERVMHLIRTNEGACRIFYRHAAAQQMSTAEAVALMLLLCRCLRGCIKATQGESPSMNASGDSSISSSGDNELDKENEDVGEDAELSLKDKDVLNGMLEIIAILWTGIGNQLTKPSNQHLKMMLVKKFSKALPDFLANFQDARSIPAIMILASYLPASSIPSFSNGCLSSLKTLPVTATADSFGPLLTCLISWGRGRDVLELIGNWLELTLTSRQKMTDEYAKEEEQDKSRKKKKRRVAFVEPVQPQPLMGLRFLDCIFSHYPSRARLLQSCTNEVIELIAILKKAM